ncbi:unnamed protein product, partial [Rotaria sp. Silwood2]
MLKDMFNNVWDMMTYIHLHIQILCRIIEEIIAKSSYTRPDISQRSLLTDYFTQT